MLAACCKYDSNLVCECEFCRDCWLIIVWAILVMLLDKSQSKVNDSNVFPIQFEIGFRHRHWDYKMLNYTMQVGEICLLFLASFPLINYNVILKMVSVTLSTFEIEDYITKLHGGFTNWYSFKEQNCILKCK